MMGTIYIIGLVLLARAAAEWSVVIPPNITVHMNEIVSIPFSILFENDTNLPSNIFVPETVLLSSANTDIATLDLSLMHNETSFYGTLNLTGVFLGKTKLILTLVENGNNSRIEVSNIIIVRQERLIDTMFTTSVVLLVSILYINFGCAMDWSVCRDTLKRPIGPAIGFFCQFLIMPLLSFFIGYLLFPDHPELQIGLFFTGISPSGGASNIWTVLLDGNLSLSVTMTTICTIAAFGMMPFWIFTLGRYIFAQAQITIPYRQIGTLVIGPAIPLLIGFLIQKKLPKVSRTLVKVMKPFSIILILFIVIFAIMTNLYLFKLFSWKIIIAGMGLPWLGFTFGFVVASIFKQSKPDIRAIAIETGVQNTGVAIFLLRFTLKPPEDDLTTVVPVSTAIMTPMPLLILYIIKLIYQCRQKAQRKMTLDSIPSFENLQQTTDISTITQLNESKLINHAE